MVLIWTNVRTNTKEHEHKKLKMPCIGPFEVSKVLENTCEIMIGEDEAGEEMIDIINLSNVKKFYVRPEWMVTPEQDVEITEMEIESSISEEQSPEEINSWEEFQKIFGKPELDNTSKEIISPNKVEEFDRVP
jgi:hypothetical protein